jgi:hypothetical protein
MQPLHTAAAMLGDLYAAVLIAASIALIAVVALGHRPFHGRHHPRRAAVCSREDAAAVSWIRELRPDRSLAGLRLRRDLRRWIPRERRLP